MGKPPRDGAPDARPVALPVMVRRAQGVLRFAGPIVAAVADEDAALPALEVRALPQAAPVECLVAPLQQQPVRGRQEEALVLRDAKPLIVQTIDVQAHIAAMARVGVAWPPVVPSDAVQVHVEAILRGLALAIRACCANAPEARGTDVRASREADANTEDVDLAPVGRGGADGDAESLVLGGLVPDEAREVQRLGLFENPRLQDKVRLVEGGVDVRHLTGEEGDQATLAEIDHGVLLLLLLVNERHLTTASCDNVEEAHSPSLEELDVAVNQAVVNIIIVDLDGQA
mmetsp:Transcript_33030/g.75188  ORF Transcript_33030/g.75188 Transcript_33030/m.75188 type:complete len:286 (-) Transcript_33030:763-1620(-)